MTPVAYLYICDGDIDHPVLTHKKMDWPEKYPHWQEIPLVMAQPEQEPVQVSPLEFVTMTLEKEHLVGKPIIWAEWPCKEKNT